MLRKILFRSLQSILICAMNTEISFLNSRNMIPMMTAGWIYRAGKRKILM